MSCEIGQNIFATIMSSVRLTCALLLSVTLVVSGLDVSETEAEANGDNQKSEKLQAVRIQYCTTSGIE